MRRPEKNWDTKHWCCFEGHTGSNKRTFVSTAGIFVRYKEWHVRKCSVFFLVLFSDHAFFSCHKPLSGGGGVKKSIRTWGEDFGCVRPNFALLLASMGFALFPASKNPILMKSSVLLERFREKTHLNSSSGFLTPKMSFQGKRRRPKIKKKIPRHFLKCYFCSLRRNKLFFCYFHFGLEKTAPVLRFPACRPLPRAPVLRFPAFGTKMNRIPWSAHSPG